MDIFKKYGFLTGVENTADTQTSIRVISHLIRTPVPPLMEIIEPI
jgi:hypothetical protein